MSGTSPYPAGYKPGEPLYGSVNPRTGEVTYLRSGTGKNEGGGTFSLDEAYGPSQGQGGPGTTFSTDEAYQEQTNADQGNNILGQLGSGAVRGVASLPGLPADLASLGFRGAEYLGNRKPAGLIPENLKDPNAYGGGIVGMGSAMGLSALDRLLGTSTGAQPRPQAELPWAPWGSETFRTAVNRNLPLAPQAPTGTPGAYAESVGEFAGPTALTGAGLLRAATSATARGTAGPILRSIAHAPRRFVAGETAAATLGGIGSEAGKEIDPNNPIAPALGGLAGALAPAGLMAGMRGLVRGGAQGASQMRNTLEDFSRIGQTPTLAQATTGRYTTGQLMSRILEFTPGGILPTHARLRQQLDASAAAIDQTIARATGGLGTSEQAAGEALQQGARRFADKVNRTQASLERRLEAAVPANTRMAPNHTLQALADLAQVGVGSEVGQATISPTVRQALVRFSNDAIQHGGPTFGAIKAFRTLLGSKTSSGQSLIPDVSSRDANMLYGALTKDMEEAAAANGAQDIVNLRNSYYSQRKSQIEDIFNPKINNPRTVEAVYRAVRQADHSQLSQIMRQLTPQQRRLVAGQVLHEIGLPPPGQATGDTAHFSLDAFDTNFEKLNRKGALDNLFRLSGTEDLRSALEDVARVAEHFKGSEKFLRNPSGTAPVGIQIGGLTSVAAPLWNMEPIMALKMAALVYGVPYALVRGGNSAGFLRLIAQTGQATSANLPGHLARLATFARLNPDYAPAVKRILEQAQPQQQQAPH